MFLYQYYFSIMCVVLINILNEFFFLNFPFSFYITYCYVVFFSYTTLIFISLSFFVKLISVNCQGNISKSNICILFYFSFISITENYF